MKAAILRKPGPLHERSLTIEEIAIPVPGPGHAVLKIRACGVCRTDLHIVEGDIPARLDWIIPGHQVVAEIVQSPDPHFQKGDRVGISWIGGTDGSCRFCRAGRENLCDHPSYTGYTQNGGFAEYMTARTDFLFPLPNALEDRAAAPLLCAGIIGFRSLKVAEVKPGQHVGLFGFGSSAQLLIQVLKAWGCHVYVSTRELQHQRLALTFGASWAAVRRFRLGSWILQSPSLPPAMSCWQHCGRSIRAELSPLMRFIWIVCRSLIMTRFFGVRDNSEA